MANDDLSERQLITALYKGCKANRSYSYKVYFPGSLIDLKEPIYKLEVPKGSVVVL